MSDVGDLYQLNRNMLFALNAFYRFELSGEVRRAANPGGTQHIHIRGGKSDIFGSEYCEK